MRAGRGPGRPPATAGRGPAPRSAGPGPAPSGCRSPLAGEPDDPGHVGIEPDCGARSGAKVRRPTQAVTTERAPSVVSSLPRSMARATSASSGRTSPGFVRVSSAGTRERGALGPEVGALVDVGDQRRGPGERPTRAPDCDRALRWSKAGRAGAEQRGHPVRPGAGRSTTRPATTSPAVRRRHEPPRLRVAPTNAAPRQRGTAEAPRPAEYNWCIAATSMSARVGLDGRGRDVVGAQGWPQDAGPGARASAHSSGFP